MCSSLWHRGGEVVRRDGAYLTCLRCGELIVPSYIASLYRGARSIASRA